MLDSGSERVDQYSVNHFVFTREQLTSQVYMQYSSQDSEPDCDYWMFLEDMAEGHQTRADNSDQFYKQWAS